MGHSDSSVAGDKPNLLVAHSSPLRVDGPRARLTAKRRRSALVGLL
jgi:hypothetical protein